MSAATTPVKTSEQSQPATPATPTKRATRTYHVGPWRQAIAWILFLPFVIALAIAAMYADAADARAGLWIATGWIAFLMLAIVWMVRRARLEIGPDGVVLRQIGYRFESTWANIVAMRVDRGHECFITDEPVKGKGANTVAAAANIAPYGGWYDAEQLALLDEHRLVPIEAFGWHLRNGMMAREIRRFAPHLAGDLAMLDRKPVKSPEQARSDRRLLRWMVLIIAASFAFSGVLIALGERSQQLFFDSANMVIDPLFALSSALATWQMIKRRSWLFTVLMALMTVIMILWTLLDLGRLIG